MILSGSLDIDWNLSVEVENIETGEHSTERVHNKVPTATRNVIRDLLNNGAYSTSLNAGWFALGTSGTAPADGDTALGAEVLRDVVTTRTTANNQLTVTYFLASTQANGQALIEAGLFNAAAVGLLLAHAIFTVVNKTAALQVTFTWTINLAG